MAKIHFLYRSQKHTANLDVRFQFTHGDDNYLISAKTSRKTTKSIWFTYYLNYHPRSGNKTYYIRNNKKYDIKKETEDEFTTPRERKNGAAALNSELIKLDNIVNDEFSKLTPIQYKPDFLKPWFQKIVDDFYNPNEDKIVISAPGDLVSYIDYFIGVEDLSPTMVKKYTVLKKKLEKFQDFRGKPLEISGIDNVFRKEFLDYMRDVGMYNDHTIFRDFGYISTICKSASDEGIKLNRKFKAFKAPAVKKIIHEILTPEEIIQVENVTGLSESLDNVRDWYLISLYTGQRIGDFLQFDSKMIREQDGQRLLEFEQDKTKELMAIPIIPKFEKILEKRGGEFPRKISDQKYNDYLKLVLKEAGFIEEVEGRKLTEVSLGVWRKRDVTAPRYEFFSSHSGRRSFASNAFGKMPISDIMYLTGHTVEKTFLIYVNKKKPDRAIETAPKLAALFSDNTKEKDQINALLEAVRNKEVDIETLINTLNN